MAESHKEKHLRKLAKAAGGEVRKVRWVGRRGAPDDLVLLPGCYFLIELKDDGKAPTTAQAREHARLRRAGMNVEWTDSVAGLNAIFARYAKDVQWRECAYGVGRKANRE